MFIFLLGCFFITIGHRVISQTIYANRVLEFWPFLGLLIFSFLYYINIALAIQLRSYRKEPLVWVSLVGGLLILVTTAIAAKYFSVNEVILAMLAIQFFLISPASFYIWRNRNREYRLND